MEYNNLSNGITDGLVLFYMKDGKLKPVALTKEQAELLDISISIPFSEDKCHVGTNNINVKNGVVQYE